MVGRRRFLMLIAGMAGVGRMVSGWWYSAPRPCGDCGQRVHSHWMTRGEIVAHEAETGRYRYTWRHAGYRMDNDGLRWFTE